MRTLYLSALFLSVVQIQHVLSTGCHILSVSSPSASSLRVAWSAYTGATYYQLDSRIVNSTTTAPVTVEVSTAYTQKQIQGLRPGNVYRVTLNVFVFFSIVCTDVKIAMTVPDTTQFISVEPISSTSVTFEWNNVIGADSFLLFMEQYDSPSTKHSKTFTTWTGVMDGLQPSTTYNCYIYSINSAGQSYRSATKTVMTLVQPPANVNVASTGRSTAHVTWTSVSDVLLYAVTVTDADNPSNSPVIINTSGTSKDISNLEPCSTYTIGVSSLNIFLVPGEPTSVSHTTSNINPVTTISVDYSCTGSLVTVSWDLVFGANSYRATAVDGTGASLNCTSASTSCQITMLSCGETYQVHVAAISDDCTSTSNTLTTFETMPCAPANVQTDHTCSTNVIVFSWDHTNKTNYYKATSEDTNGVKSECLTVKNNCYFTNVECGQMYNFTVFAVSSECSSDVSQPKTVQTSPCQPENVQTTYECLSDKLITAWDLADGADSYTVEIKGNTDESYNCTTTSNSCEITGMPCGEHFSVWISASNEMCTTPEELAEISQTVPCTPENASASVDCSQDSARVNWTTSDGAIYYIVIAQESNGNIHGCFSMGSNCLINTLTCGNTYTAKVIATNIECNSTNNEEFTFSTAPCGPASVQALRSCDENLARIEWQNHQPNGLYTATIEDQSGAQLTCTNDTVNYCTISSLPCGKTYSVTVTYSEGNCASTSTPISMDSVPCGPEDVIASVACDTEELTLTWNVSLPADNFTAVITGETGPALQCNSIGTQCTTGGLLCGKSYSVTVSSTNGMCSSRPSTEVTVQTWPCPPTNVTVTQTCSSAPVPVSWTASDGAKSYTAVATSSGGHSTDCSTNQTSCSLAGLQCGEVYTIGVSGANDNCTGQLSNTVTLDTEPCTPSNVSSQLMCDAGIADVFWTPAANAVSYNVTATSNGQTLICSSSSPNCTLSNLVCDHAYDIQVTATDGMCVSSYSAVFSQDPVPCAPQNISMNLLCGTNDLMVSWVPSLNPLKYTVTALPLSGSAVTYYTSNASLSLSGLQCGGTYNVTIKASSGSCSGAYSAPQTIQTAPCPPQSLTAEAQCGTNSLLASWNTSLGATTYTATVTGPESFSDSCSSSSLTCSVFGLQCSSQYNVTLTSQDGHCTSAPIQTVLTTGPCDPANVTSSLHCGSDMATVSWVASAGAVAYTVVAQDTSSQSSTSCRSSTTSCQLSQLQCGRVYNLTVVAEDASCNSTGNTEAVLMTAPCAPSIHNSTNICGASSSSLSWELMADAVGYTVNATATSGHQVSCSSATATCTLTNVQCSETYTATVVAQGSQCDSTPGPSSNFSTEPCSPSVISKHYTCNTSTAEFSWTNPAGSLGFVAHIAGEGYQDDCNTTDTSCVFHSLPCDLCLNITVQAQGSQCNSLPSVIESMETVPCTPQNVSATLGCLNHSASVTWAGSPSAIGYNVTLTSQDGHTHHCHSDTSSCDVPDIHCGETYSITVTPFSMTCTGNQSAAYSFSSGLCPPSNVSVSPNCEDNTVSWSLVPGAEMYIATASAEDGHTHTCSSNSSNTCHFTDLHCGEIYSVTVQTVDRGCFSEPSSAVVLTTAPCLPENVSAEVQCNTNVMAVSWAQTTGSGDYTAWAISTDGHNASCNSTSNSCSISGLQCGKVYEVSVTPSTTQCSVIAASDYRVQAAPCKPENTTAEQNCSSNVMSVTWDEGNTAQNYTVTASPASGVNSTCVSTGSSCSFLDLSCGQLYTFTVMGHTNVCMSEMSTPIEKMTAPCAPTNVSANMNCTTHDALLSWSSAAGAEAYNVQANSTNGHGSSCSGAGTSCNLDSLVCGEEYSAVVEPLDTGCPGPASSPVTFTTEPCVPTSLSVQYNASTAQVMWGTASGADSYSVEAVTDQGPAVTCDTNNTSCLLTGLQCSQVYNVTVIAHNEACDSSVSGTHQLLTEPCPPTNVQANVACESLTVTVSWDQSALAVGYVAYVDSQSGHYTSCAATNTQCTVSGVMCGAVYNVWVKALGQVYNSSDSTVVSLTSGPCQPSSIDAVMNCEARFATISWQLSVGAVSYTAELTSTSGHATGCTTNHTHCEVSSLQCGEEYNVTVMALGETCNSSAQMAGHLTTAPCLPGDILTVANCNSDGAANVSWNTISGAANFSLTAFVSGSVQTLCTTQENSCNVTDLACGETYNLNITVSNEECSLTAMMPTNVTTRPCPPQGVTVDLGCGSNTTVLSWVGTSDVELYKATAIKASGGEVKKCNSTGSTCHFPSLVCGETYNFTVTALSQDCCSQASSTVSLQTEPCQPVITSVQTLCQSEQVQISWGQTSGVVNYAVTVKGNLEFVKDYNTTGTILSVPLPCGQHYNVTVQGQGYVCESIPSSPAFFKTGPCIPQNVTTYMQCDLNKGSVSWDSSDGAETYVAEATGLDGHNHQCPTNTTSCTWDDLHCGESYTVVVRAKDDNCTSLPSSSAVICMDPCVPENVFASADCNRKVVSLTWAASNGSETYNVTAEAENTTTQLMTNVTTVDFFDLACGQDYNLTVTPHSNHCAGSSSEQAFIQTWPCAPSEISILHNSLTDFAIITWQASNGSDSHTVSLQSDSGVSTTAVPTGSHLNVTDLDCGYNFSVSVTAYNQQCNATSSEDTFLQSAPCVPTNVTVVRDCVNNTALVSWSASRGALQYSVTARCSNGTVSYQTSDLSYNLDNLACGSSYTIQVLAMDDRCSSAPSLEVMLDSAPCPPQNVSAQFSCSSNDMTISWDAVGEADHFLVSATADNGGISESCNTTNTWSSFSNVSCGKTFTVHVTSVRGNCPSQPSQTCSILSAPCQPQGISGNIDCVTNSAWISWSAALGADSYTVSAVGGEDFTANCTTSSNTTCEVEDLACGVHYDFNVTAENSQCESQPSATINLHTAPCSLSAITAFPQCHNSSILVVWELMEGSVGNTVYIATAKASDNTTLSCNDTGISCYLHGAQCDLRYTIIVAASSDQCSSMRSPPYRIYMEPCPPQNMSLSSSCEEHNSVMVSWTPSPVAEAYSVVATAADAHVHTCNTTSSSSNCSISALHCDQQYTFFVTASHENCSSEASENATLNTGPCPPSGVSVTFHCNNGSAELSWMPGVSAVEYYGCAQSENGEMLYCSSTSLTCTIEGLDCGEVYNFTVRASDGTCNSSLSDPVQQGAVPCPPDGVEVQVLPMQMEAQALLFSWNQVSCNDSWYLVTLTGSLLGESMALFQILSYWTNSLYFEIPLPCGSAYNATVHSRNSAGTSDPSETLSGLTAPCPPTNAMYSSSGPVSSIYWDASVFASAYTVYDNSVTPWVQMCRVTGLSCNLSNVTSSNLVVTASNAAGESEVSIINLVP
ncbi:mucin-4-like [Solea solea]|uniref:mucin-4-like n=1 Tax=Solea solea TaxID=90069 RepID=UPI0027296E05|nr:mucin-4-like [Solea solea]